MPRFVHAALCLGMLAAAAPTAAQQDFYTFESDPVRPLALSADGQRLFVANTPDDTLEVFAVTGTSLSHVASVSVGMEPVAVATRANGEVWVVNHLSDSVSIVDTTSFPFRVVRTLLVGDEPRDIVFAGAAAGRAFVTAAHRGQNSPYPRGEYDVPGVGRADVWVFDANAPGASFGGDPLVVLTLFGDRPRALAVSPDGATVYAGVYRSGNRTMPLGDASVCNGGATAAPCTVGGASAPGGLPAPNRNVESFLGPEVGLVLRQDRDGGASGEWQDELGRDWSPLVKFDLPDQDVFAIDATASPPAVAGSFAGVGTVLFNMATNPVSGKVYVSNTEALNEVRFEGAGIVAAAQKPPGEPASVRGHLHEARITVLDGAAALSRHLNKHIDYDVVPSPAGVKERSLATPLGMAVSSDGQTLYVAAFGSGKIGVFSTAELEADSFVPDAADHIELSGGGPAGLVLDEANGRLYVLTRFDMVLSAVDPATRQETQRLRLNNPEPPAVVAGRPFLYDARGTSSNGEASCSSCHLFGDMDDLAWDLGDPDGLRVPNPNPSVLLPGVSPFHPMKGPMTTQSLRGLAQMGPMHWRGDRTGGSTGGDPLDEEAAFNAFNVAFPGLLGNGAQLATADMQAFTEFALHLSYPPNPIRQLDNALRPDEATGRNTYLTRPGTDVIARCVDCHTLDPAAGFLGGNGFTSFEGETQEFKIPHLRNAYQKVGMFGMPADPFTGDQVRGVGFLHDGSIDTVFRFLGATLFQLTDQDQRELEAFVMAFDTTLAPIVGQQVTLRSDSLPEANARVDLLLARAAVAFPLAGHPGATETDVVVKGRVAGEARGWVRLASGSFQSDRSGEALLSAAQLKALVTPTAPLTFTAVPPGAGVRRGIDRDRDGALDADERDAATDPANPGSLPGACSDGLDNDGDGAADGSDLGCASASATLENPACDDGLDNDGDGAVDAVDPHCATPAGQSELAVSCGLGAELALLLPLWAVARRRAARRSG